MFRKTRIKIVILIMTVSIVLISGVLCVIYLASSSEVKNRNRSLLEHYAENYTINQNIAIDGNNALHGNHGLLPNEKGFAKPLFELSTFYSVYYSGDGEALYIDNDEGSLYSKEQILAYADAIRSSGKEQGTYLDFYYMVEKSDDHVLIAFLDNTLESDSFSTILKYTLVFGSITLLVIFVLSCMLSRKLIQPLEQNDARQRQFISDAGHELKTPLAIVETNAEMLARETGKNKWLDNIRYETGRMSNLVKTLMTLSKAEDAAPEMERVNLSRILLGECLSFESTAFESGRELNYNAVPKNIFVTGNSGQLAQLSAILIDNAISHADLPGEICLSLKSVKNRAYLSVTNPGTPIPAEKQSHLFERFYRGDFARNGDSGHYGLGLSIAKAVVTAHKGELFVDCKDNKITFTVILSAKSEAL